MESSFQELIDSNYKFPKLLKNKQPLKQLHHLLSIAHEKSKNIDYEVKPNQSVPKCPEKMRIAGKVFAVTLRPSIWPFGATLSVQP